MKHNLSITYWRISWLLPNFGNWKKKRWYKRGFGVHISFPWEIPRSMTGGLQGESMSSFLRNATLPSKVAVPFCLPMRSGWGLWLPYFLPALDTVIVLGLGHDHTCIVVGHYSFNTLSFQWLLFLSFLASLCLNNHKVSFKKQDRSWRWRSVKVSGTKCADHAQGPGFHHEHTHTK
jgi:hypothetical protein